MEIQYEKKHCFLLLSQPRSAFGSLLGDPDADYRMMASYGGTPPGGGERAISTGVSWTFDDTSNKLTSVVGSDNTPGAALQTPAGDYSAAPDGDTGLFKNAQLLERPFSFLAPAVGSAAGNAYGAATISGDLSSKMVLAPFFPLVLEAQWERFPFTVGKTSGGTTFNCNAIAGVFSCQGEVIFAINDSPIFTGHTLQFDLAGTMPAVPVPAAIWFRPSGLVGVARRRKYSEFIYSKS